MPALLSSAIYLILFHTTDLEEEGNEIMDHPYPMGALVAAFTFLLSFRYVFVSLTLLVLFGSFSYSYELGFLLQQVCLTSSYPLLC